jgi:hypothetical protein
LLSSVAAVSTRQSLQPLFPHKMLFEMKAFVTEFTP